ncbi:MAG: hypothetical protein HC895_16340 [Leptolyngbyaceae cyanobacterium SM1_3_5]|nr:hypothetical protein [Leptolyngbyaceae cyanobacterium SM1_3_5]
MSWLAHHTRSEEYAGKAEKFYRQQEVDRAAEFYRLAAEAELHALESLDFSKTRTIGITSVSVVSLCYKACEFLQAKRIAHKWLSTELLPAFAVDELEELLQVIRYEESRAKTGIQFIEGEVIVSVSGGEVLYGAAPLELVLLRVEKIRSIFYRTTELLLDLPLRKRGGPTQEVKNQCDPWLFQAPPGSYQFAVRVRKPKKYEQLAFEGMIDLELRVEQVTKKFLDIVRATAQDPEGELIEIVPQEDYRETFLKLTRELAPPSTGKSFDQLEIKSSSDIEPRPIVLRPDTREVIKNVLKKPKLASQEAANYRIIQLKGTLHGLQLDDDWIEVSIDGNNQKIYDAKEEIDDVIGSMVNRRVAVEVAEHSDRPAEKKYSLRDIQLEED